MREILVRILLIDCHRYEMDSTAWRDSWLRFASKEACGDPPTSIDPEDIREDEIENWIDVAVSSMATRGEFLKNLIAEPSR
jgi:hypothetical protein